MRGGGSGLTQDTTSGFDSWESDIVDVGYGTDIGISITLASTGTTAPKVKLMGTIDGENFGYLRDDYQTVIEIDLEETTNIRSVQPFLLAIKLVGSANGVGSGNLTDYTILKR